MIICMIASLTRIPHAGLLESVSNLAVTPVNSTTVLISWSPPFTLEGVPILGYNVTITNTTSGENETLSVKGDTNMLYYSIDHLKSTFTITVVPINMVGAGDKASILYSTSKLLSDQWDLLYKTCIGFLGGMYEMFVTINILHSLQISTHASKCL